MMEMSALEQGCAAVEGGNPEHFPMGWISRLQTGFLVICEGFIGCQLAGFSFISNHDMVAIFDPVALGHSLTMANSLYHG